MTKIVAKEGTSFSILCSAVNSVGAAYDLSTFEISANITGGAQDKTLTAGDGLSVIDISLGTYRLDISLAGFSPNLYSLDIKYTDGLITEFSKTIKIETIKAV